MQIMSDIEKKYIIRFLLLNENETGIHKNIDYEYLFFKIELLITNYIVLNNILTEVYFDTYSYSSKKEFFPGFHFVYNSVNDIFKCYIDDNYILFISSFIKKLEESFIDKNSCLYKHSKQIECCLMSKKILH